MNEIVSAFILAIVQGVTEWLPISSQGHLVVLEHFLGYSGGLTFDIALHFGTLLAAFVYFRKDIIAIIEDFLRGNWKSEDGRMGWLLIVATIPAALVGYLFYDFFERTSQSLVLAAWEFAITGIVLILASLDFKTRTHRVRWKEALVIGVAQIAAILPSISRSGVTIAAGLFMGLSEKTAVRFSFLMSIPIIFGASLAVFDGQAIPLEWVGPMIVSFIVGICAIHLMLHYFLKSKRALRWFGAYTLLLAMALGVWIAFQ